MTGAHGVPIGTVTDEQARAIGIAYDELVSYVEVTGDEGSLDAEEMPDGTLRWACDTLRLFLRGLGRDYDPELRRG